MVADGPNMSATRDQALPLWTMRVGVRGGHGVVAAGGPRVAAASRRTASQVPAHAAVLGHRLERVRRAARVVAADLAVERADQGAVGAQQPDQDVLHDAQRHRARVRRPAARQRASSAPSSALRRRRGARQRPDHQLGRRPGRSRQVIPDRWRSRRFTRLRTTALPTALPTTKPTRGPASPRPVASSSRCTTRAAPPPAGPDSRCAGRRRCRAADGRRRARALLDEPEPALRPRGSCGPCGGARR